MLVIVPTRGRPHKMQDLITSWAETRTHARLMIAADEDDPKIHDYLTALKYAPAWVEFVETPVPDGGATMVHTLNSWAVWCASTNEVQASDVIGFMGDDHRPRTPGWDAQMQSIFDSGLAIAYGNDTIQGPNLPTHVLMSRRFIQALRCMVPPVLTHLFADNYWRELGQRTGTLRYRHDVIIEHMHPVAGKAEWDDEYKRVNHGSMYERDSKAFRRYVDDGHLDADATKIMGVMK